MKKNRGFTITELLAVVVILGLIVAIAVPVYFNVSKSVRENEYKSKKSYIESIASRYAEENNATTAQVFSVGQLVASGYMSAEDYVDSDGTSIPYLANPTNSNDNLACHTVTITVENYDYNASMSDESNCEIVTSEVKASEMGIKAYKLYGDSVGSEINIIGQSIDWVNTDVLISVNPKYEWNSMSLSINGETKEVDKEKVCTSPVVSDCSNIIIVRAEVILKNTVAISVQTEDKVNATTIEVKIDKEAPTVTTEKNDAWVSENKQTIVYASDGSGSGAKSVYVTSTNVRPNVGTNSCTISNRCFSVSDEITGTILVEGLNNGTYYLWGMDKAGNLAMTSTVLTITNVDDSPAIGEMTVRSSKSEYNSKEVVVSLNASDSESGVVEVCITTEDNSANCNWQKYANDIFTTNYQIATDEGSGNNYTIYGFIKDGVGHVTKLGSKPYSVYKACSVIKYVNEKEAYDSNLNTRCPEQDKVNEAYFNTGYQVNRTMRSLANSTSYYDKVIKGFERSNTLQSNSVLLSSYDSPLPIYAWYSNNTIYWYTEAEDVYLNKDSSYMFYRLDVLTNLNLSQINASKVTNMSYMFQGMSKLTSLNLGNNFDTSNVTNMSYMFDMSISLKSLNLGSKFNTSNVTNMSYMFRLAGMTTLNLGNNFDTSKVRNMSHMFEGMTDDITSINLGNNFDTSSVTDMSYMFSNIENLMNIYFNNKFDTSNVTNMSYMFKGLNNMTSLDLSTFNTSKVTDMSGMLGSLWKLTSLNISSFNTSKVTNMSGMFSGMRSIKSLNISNFDTSNVTDTGRMFDELYEVTTLNLGNNFDTSKVTNMNGMFQGLKKITSLNLGNKFNTSNVTTMNGMFANMYSITSLDLSQFNTSKVQSFYGKMDTGMISGGTPYGMLQGCSNLKTIYINPSIWNTNSVTSSTNMFEGDYKLIGGSGTKYNSSRVDKTYARVDGGTSSPGYLTRK